MTNYLDDFLFLTLSALACNNQIDIFLRLCSELNVPISLEKMERAQVFIIFLGILLDGCNFCLGIPTNKRDKALRLLHTMMDKKKATVKDLQVLSGYLNFIRKAVFPGCAFTRHMYWKYSNLVNVNHNKSPDNRVEFSTVKLKQHHHVQLDSEFKADCAVWVEFLSGELKQVVSRPMVDLIGTPVTTSDQISFYSDASASKRLGFGSILNNKWIQGFWPESFIVQAKPSIEFLELFTLTAGILAWESEPELRNCHVLVFL